MELSIRKIAKVAGIRMAIATVIAEVAFVLFFVFGAIDSYYNYVTIKVLNKDVYGTVVVDSRTSNGITYRYLLSINDGIVVKSKITSEVARKRYPEPRSVINLTGKTISHDGSKIAYYKHKRIYISDTLGNNTVEVVGGHYMVTPMEGSSIAWSPNDKYLAFCGQTILGQVWPTYNTYIVPVNEKNSLKTLCYDVDYVFYWK